jgi:hypothetical protein
MEQVDADRYQQTLVITPDLWNQVDIQVVLIMYLQMAMQSSSSLTPQSIQTTFYGVKAITQLVNQFLINLVIL